MSTPTPPTAPAAPSPWMTREEAAEYIRVAPRTLDRIVREGKLTRFRLAHGDKPRFRRAEVMRLIEIDDRVGQRGGPNLVQATQRSLQSRGHLAPQYEEDAPQLRAVIESALDVTGPRPLTE